MLLQNARLDENTSNAITIQLFAKAESRKSVSAAGQAGIIKVNASTMSGFRDQHLVNTRCHGGNA